MVYELRIYHMHPGRMDAIKQRFIDHALHLLDEGGIKIIDFWLDAQGNERLYYICEYESLEERERVWKDYMQNPAWIEAKKQSELDGPIVTKVESFMMEKADFFYKLK